MKTLLIIAMVCVINLGTCSVASKKWKDPHDMNTNAKQKYQRSSSFESSFANAALNPQGSSNSQNTCFFNLKRIVSVLMKAAHIDKENRDLYQGHVRFAIKPEDHQFLLNFGKEDITLDTLRDLNAIFSEGFQKSFIEGYLANIKSFQSQLYSAVVNIETLWILGTAYMVYFVHQLMKNGFSLVYMSKFILLLVMITDFGFRHYHLVQEAEEHNLKVAYSSKCDTRKMSWAEWTKFIFGSEECEKRSVTPLDTLLHQVKHLIIIPMQAVGTGMGGFGSNMFSSLRFPFNLILWPIMLVFILLLVLITLTIFTGHPIEFNVFHLIKLKFGDSRKNDNSLTNSNLEKLVDTMGQRSIVHNVNISIPPAMPANSKFKDGEMRIEDIANPALKQILDEHDELSCKKPAEDSAPEKTCSPEDNLDPPKPDNLSKTFARSSINQNLTSAAGMSSNQVAEDITHKSCSPEADVDPLSLPNLPETATKSSINQNLAAGGGLSYNQPAEYGLQERPCSSEAYVDPSTTDHLLKTVAESIKQILIADAGSSCGQTDEYSLQEKINLSECYAHRTKLPKMTEIIASSDLLCNQPAEDSSQGTACTFVADDRPKAQNLTKTAETIDSLDKLSLNSPTVQTLTGNAGTHLKDDDDRERGKVVFPEGSNTCYIPSLNARFKNITTEKGIKEINQSQDKTDNAKASNGVTSLHCTTEDISGKITVS